MMNKIIIIIALIFTYANLCYGFQEPISSSERIIWKSGDTLVNFNKVHSNTVTTLEVSSNEKIPEFLQLSQNGFILFSQDITNFLPAFSFEIKTITFDNEVYINIVSSKNMNETPFVYVSSDKIDMATGWRADGKIYVVIAVSIILFMVLAFYLLIMDRRLAKLEK